MTTALTHEEISNLNTIIDLFGETQIVDAAEAAAAAGIGLPEAVKLIDVLRDRGMVKEINGNLESLFEDHETTEIKYLIDENNIPPHVYPARVELKDITDKTALAVIGYAVAAKEKMAALPGDDFFKGEYAGYVKALTSITGIASYLNIHALVNEARNAATPV